MDIGNFIPLILKHSSYVLTTHLNPDGDGLGVQIALREYLLGKNKSVRCINHSPTPRHYQFLDPDNTIIEVFNNDEHATVISETDCIIVLDTNVPGRLGNMEESVRASSAVKLVIDHHLDKDDFADHYLVDEDAAATGEIVFKLLSAALDNKLTNSIAKALYTAIMTDTGSYRFPKTGYATHLMTAELLKYNVNPSAIYREVYERGPVNRMVLLGKTLATLEIYHENRVAVMKVPEHFFTETNTDLVETDGFVNYTLQVDKVEIGLLFTEFEDTIKISFRARGEIWVNEFAKEFGGNGHQHAAGATIPNGNLNELIHTAVKAAPKYLP